MIGPHNPSDMYCICDACHRRRCMTAEQMREWFWANYEVLMGNIPTTILPPNEPAD